MMVWLIPVIAVVVVLLLILIIVITCRRKRQSKKEKEALLNNRELDQQEPMDVAKFDEQDPRIIALNADHTNNMLHHIVPTTIGSHAVAKKDFLHVTDCLDKSSQLQAEGKTKMGVKCGAELTEVSVNVNNTLYNRLHKGSPPLDTPNVFRMITGGLAQIAKHNPKMPILTQLSPLWVFLDEQDIPLFQIAAWVRHLDRRVQKAKIPL
ncbi:hypothetical protein BLNAU_20312 [Blattamonas nauphoetae]|uniref:Uncharacterized protein n=1 Tax=Blattamonas nauphoetae TaxID=2049346 RepID=A0ABQ9WZ36_9EUKA|nr:hypothetical protein BLNAU_20312 [Blattamonas nauphoetae]